MLSQHQPGFTFTPDRLEFELTQLLHFWFSAGTCEESGNSIPSVNSDTKKKKKS